MEKEQKNYEKQEPFKIIEYKMCVNNYSTISSVPFSVHDTESRKRTAAATIFIFVAADAQVEMPLSGQQRAKKSEKTRHGCCVDWKQMTNDDDKNGNSNDDGVNW